MLRYSKRLFSKKINPQTQLFINGQFVNSQSGQTFSTINPSTQEEICQVQRAGPADVDIAVKAAQSAFEIYSQLPPQARAAILHKLSDKIDANADEIATIESVDNGKPFAMAMRDTQNGSAILRYYAGICDKIQGDQYPMAGNFLAFSEQVPIGVCGQIIPWNFPLLLMIIKLGPVLASGCTSIIKPAENTPLSALKVAQLIKECDIPDGVINVLPGFGSDCGKAIVTHPDVQKIAFTGSTATGKQVQKDAADTCKRVSLELGGKCPNIILDDCDIDAAVQTSVFAGFLNSGQFCMIGSRVLVQEGIYDEFVAKIVSAVQKWKVGDAFEEGVNNGPLISEDHMNKVLGYIQKGIDQGATLKCGGKRMDKKGFFVEMTVFSDCTQDMDIVRDEIFGPVISIQKFKTVDEAIQMANDTKYGLASGVQTKNLTNALKISRKMQSGQCWVNNWMSVQPATPFGGFKQSGQGRDQGFASMSEYLEQRVTIISTE